MKKKSQIKFGETFAIVMIVYIIIVVGMVWYNNINTKSIKEMQEQDFRDRSFEKYDYIINSQLLHVSSQSSINKEFDYNSLKIFKDFSQQNREFIRKELGEATIIIKIYNTNLESLENITLYNNTYNNSKNVAPKNRETFKTLVPVKDLIEKTTYLGILDVIVYN